jgi:periplasmic protein TonB
MVHAIHPATHPFKQVHPDGKRIAGLATAIVFNAALFMLLAVPLHAPPGLALPEPGPVFSWIVPKPEQPKPPVVPVDHHRAPTTHPTVVKANERAPVAPVLVHDDPMASDASDTPGPPQTVETTQDTVASGPPLPGVRLEYADAPPPAYPRDALRDGAEGTVLLQVLVDIDGRPLRVDVQRSSGDRRLDQAARKQVLQHWRFRPAMKDGHAMQAIGLVPVDFHLQ